MKKILIILALTCACGLMASEGVAEEAASQEDANNIWLVNETGDMAGEVDQAPVLPGELTCGSSSGCRSPWIKRPPVQITKEI